LAQGELGKTSCEAETSKGRLPHSRREVKLKFNKNGAFEGTSYYESRKPRVGKSFGLIFSGSEITGQRIFNRDVRLVSPRQIPGKSIAPPGVSSVGFADESSCADQPSSKGIKSAAGDSVEL